MHDATEKITKQEAQSCVLATSTLGTTEWQLHVTITLPRQETPDTEQTGRTAGFRVGLHVLEKRIHLPLSENESLGFPTLSLVAAPIVLS